MFHNLEAEQRRYGYTNADMAEILGISRVTYEKKKRTGMFNRPQIEVLLRLFDCKFEYLFQFDGLEKKRSCKPSKTYYEDRPA